MTVASWRIEDGIVLENSLVGPDMGRMVVRSPHITRAARPGQFLMIRCWEDEPLLPRAMAPLSYDACAGSMEIFYRIMGPGTEAMADAPAGALAYVTGPLGRPVDEGFEGRNVALVGRGVGITPLLPLAKQVVATGGSVASYLSARTSKPMEAALIRGSPPHTRSLRPRRRPACLEQCDRLSPEPERTSA